MIAVLSHFDCRPLHIGMELVLIPTGTFMIGSPDSDAEAFDNEKPAHRVTILQPFYLGKYPVTQAQWEGVMGNNPTSAIPRGGTSQPSGGMGFLERRASIYAQTQ